MNIQAYIESGILESYVLGHTNANETVEVENLAKQYPLIEEEINAIRHSLEMYASQFACQPPVELKERVLHVLDDLATEDAEATSNIIFVPSSNNSFRYAAVWVLLAMSLVANVVLFYRWQTSSDQVLALESEKQQLAATKANYQQQLALVEHPSTEKIILQGQTIAPQAKAVVYWNTQTQEVLLSTLHLPQPSATQQYQLWAIVEGKPIDAGLIDTLDSPSLMKSFQQAMAFAISLEPKGGSSTATGPKGQIYVMGFVKHI